MWTLFFDYKREAFPQTKILASGCNFVKKKDSGTGVFL